MSEMIESAVRNKFPDAVLDSSVADGVLTLKIDPKQLKDICAFLKSASDLYFDYPMDITAIDWSDRLEMVYRLTSIRHNHKLTLRFDVDRGDPIVQSVTSVWRGVNWQEREVFDLFGVKFEGHPDLRRILLPDEFEGYPLRKDYVIQE